MERHEGSTAYVRAFDYCSCGLAPRRSGVREVIAITDPWYRRDKLTGGYKKGMRRLIFDLILRSLERDRYIQGTRDGAG